MAQHARVHLETLITEADIRTRVGHLVEEVAQAFDAGMELVVVGMLKGSFMFAADLARLFYLHDIPLVIDFMVASSYGSGTASSGRVELTRDITTDIEGKRVLLVDDILDTGRTLEFASRHLLAKKPETLRTCVFLDKPARRAVCFEADHVGFTVPDEFVVGYGLDYDGRYRELPYVSIASFPDA